ncbi:hypothetical protein [Candidatus Tisiphia endosymbiont of Sialis lutaria]
MFFVYYTSLILISQQSHKTNFFPKSYPSIEVKIKLSLSLKSKIH